MLYLNGGNINNLNQTSLVVTQKHFPVPVMEGNAFLFWCLDTECNEKYDPNTTNITNVTGLYAVWNISTVSFDPNGGTVDPQTMNVSYNSTYNSLPTPTKAGYNFTGWYNSEGKEVTPKSVVTTASDHTLTAWWEANNYTVTLNVSGGDALPTSEFTVTYDQPYNCLPNASRTGYTFIGWFTEENGGTEVTNETTVKTPNDCTLYAQWEANEYTVTLDPNGGEASETEINVTYDDAYGELPEPERIGYSFTGWFTNKTGETEVTSETIANIIADNHTLYAHWAANNYTVFFDVNGGDALSESDKTKKVTFDRPYGKLPTPNRTGHTFLGWFENETGGNKITNTTKMTRVFDHTLYAHWTVNNYTLIFDFGNGTNTSTVLTFNETIDYPMNLTKEGYTFSGWKPEPKRMPANDTTVVAQWTKIHSSSSSSSSPSFSSSSFLSPLFSSSSSGIVSELVEIVLGAKDMTQEQVKEALKKFTDEDFVIERFDVDEKTGETTIVIKFSEPEKAKDFVRNVNKARESSEWSVIKKAGFIAGNSLSAATKAETGFFTVPLALTIF